MLAIAEGMVRWIVERGRQGCYVVVGREQGCECRVDSEGMQITLPSKNLRVGLSETEKRNRGFVSDRQLIPRDTASLVTK